MTVDPLDFGSLRNPEDLLMVIGEGDRFVPEAYQEKLYAAFSRPLEGRYPPCGARRPGISLRPLTSAAMWIRPWNSLSVPDSGSLFLNSSVCGDPAGAVKRAHVPGRPRLCE